MMKEIKYDGNFGEDMKYFKEKKTGFFHKYVFNFPFILCFATMLIEVVYVFPVISGPVANVIFFSGMGLLGVYHQIHNYWLVQKKRKAYRNLKSLSGSLKREGILVGKSSFREAVLVQGNDIVKARGEDDKKAVGSKEDKICQYFCLLDKDDQIRVLKWMKSQVGDILKNREMAGSLLLLEEEDQKDVVFPVRRVLKKDERVVK